VRGFLRQRLDVSPPAEHDEIDDALPVEVDALTAWAVGDRVLHAVLAGRDPHHTLLAEQLRGDLPPLRLGERQLHDITARVQALCEATVDARRGDPRSVDVTVDLGGGRRLTGVVADVRGHRVVRVRYATLSAKHRLASWVDLLALAAAMPDASWTASTFGHHRVGPRQSLLGPVDHRAVDLLRDLVELRDRGLCEPLPLPLRTGHAYADAVRAHSGATWKARSEWEGSTGSPVPADRDDAAHVRVFGRDAPFDRLVAPPRSDERWNHERSRLGQYALRLWQPLFDHEQVIT
jgi:exodeoxyribonuclease V gamma subunit